MAINFPNSPGIGTIFTDPTAGFSYQWDGTVWKSYSAASSSQIKIIDDISGSFNGSTQTFALTVSGVSLTPANTQQLRIVLGGVIQSPGTDYTVSTSNIFFTTAPAAGLTFSGVSQGPAIPVTTIVDGATTNGAFNITGNLTVTGISTIGIGTTTTPSQNSQMSFELTSNTNLRIKVKGTDGVLRLTNLTLS